VALALPPPPPPKKIFMKRSIKHVNACSPEIISSEFFHHSTFEVCV